MLRILSVVLIACTVGLTAWGLITAYDALMPAGRMWQTPLIKPHEDPIPVMAAGSVPTTGGEAFFHTAAADDLNAPFPLTDPAVIMAGKDRLRLLLRPLPREKLRRLRHRGPEFRPDTQGSSRCQGPDHGRRDPVQRDQFRHPRRPPAAPGHHHRPDGSLAGHRLRQKPRPALTPHHSMPPGCDLCGLPLRYETVTHTLDGKPLYFCCQGCRMVYTMLVEAGEIDDPARFRESDLYRQCVAAGVIPASEADLRRMQAAGADRHGAFRSAGKGFRYTGHPAPGPQSRRHVVPGLRLGHRNGPGSAGRRQHRRLPLHHRSPALPLSSRIAPIRMRSGRRFAAWDIPSMMPVPRIPSASTCAGS